MEHLGWIDQLKHRAAYHLGIDRRTDFYDLANLEPERRTARTEVVQFYSGVPNIGNYLPVLGIREILERETDLWDAHDSEIDWRFVNQNYSWAIMTNVRFSFRLFSASITRLSVSLSRSEVASSMTSTSGL